MAAFLGYKPLMRKSTLFSIIKLAVRLQVTTACVIIRALSETELVQMESDNALFVFNQLTAKLGAWYLNKRPKVCSPGCDHKYNAGCAFSDLSTN